MLFLIVGSIAVCGVAAIAALAVGWLRDPTRLEQSSEVVTFGTGPRPIPPRVIEVSKPDAQTEARDTQLHTVAAKSADVLVGKGLLLRLH